MKTKLKIPNLSEVEEREKESNHFTKGLGFYKLFWLFLIGSFLGVVFEILWCLLTRFHYESRVGLIYGPFNLVYGFGAIAIALGLHWMRRKRKLSIFLGGVIIGTIIEYICSYVQELMFGSISWDYSCVPFNMNGRVFILYSFIWGLLAILWIKCIYPSLSAFLLKVPQKLGKMLTWILLVFMIFNTIMSILAMERWIQRRDRTVLEHNALWEYFDTRFPNKKMEQLFPNMIFVSKGKE